MHIHTHIFECLVDINRSFSGRSAGFSELGWLQALRWMLSAVKKVGREEERFVVTGYLSALETWETGLVSLCKSSSQRVARAS